jgi:hypothetical protein
MGSLFFGQVSVKERGSDVIGKENTRFMAPHNAGAKRCTRLHGYYMRLKII